MSSIKEDTQCTLFNIILFNAVKTLTSREIQRNYPEVKKILWEGKFWSRSYFLATTGQVTHDCLKKYVEDQGKEKK